MTTKREHTTESERTAKCEHMPTMCEHMTAKCEHMTTKCEPNSEHMFAKCEGHDQNVNT